MVLTKESLKEQMVRARRTIEVGLRRQKELEALSVELYEEFGAKFAGALSEYAKAFTDHSYETLTADEELNLKGQILLLSSTGREEAAAKRMGITYETVF